MTRLEINHETQTIHLAALDATACSGDVLPSEPTDYTDEAVIDHCNATLCAPETTGDGYSSYTVER